MKKGDMVFGINQSGMVGGGIVEGVLNKDDLVIGYLPCTDETHPCYELYMGPKDRTKSTSIFDYRLFEVEQVFATYDEANKFYFAEKLAGRLK